MFQFHTGSIKRKATQPQGYYKQLCFNSILVRLKVQLGYPLNLVFTRFNSILVRLKVRRLPNGTATALVSIPYWFD